MSMRPTPGFAIGSRAFFLDGRSGIVTRQEFNPVAGEWQYLLDPLGGMFRESDLFAVNPIVDAPAPIQPPPPPPPVIIAGDFVTRGEFVEQVALLTSLIQESGASIFDVRTIVGSSVAGLLESRRVALADLEGSLIAALELTRLELSEEANDLKTSIVTQLFKITNRLEGADVIADESGPGGLGGFLRRVGSFALSPFAAILGALEEYISDEVLDGLTR